MTAVTDHKLLDEVQVKLAAFNNAHSELEDARQRLEAHVEEATRVLEDVRATLDAHNASPKDGAKRKPAQKKAAKASRSRGAKKEAPATQAPPSGAEDATEVTPAATLEGGAEEPIHLEEAPEAVAEPEAVVESEVTPASNGDDLDFEDLEF